jgi:hypothetical protein
MKKILLLIAALVFTFAMTAYAAEKAADAGAQDAPRSDVKKKAHHKGQYLRGEVKAMDDKSVTIAGKKGEKTIAADAELLKNVKVGDKVVVKVKKEGDQLTVVKIKTAQEIKGKRAAKKAARKAAQEKKDADQ